MINCHVYDSKILLHFKKLAFRSFSSIKRTFNSELNRFEKQVRKLLRLVYMPVLVEVAVTVKVVINASM